MSVALQQQTTPSIAPRESADRSAAPAFKAELSQVTSQPQPADLPPVEYLDPRTGNVQRIGDLNPRTGTFTDLTTPPSGAPNTAQPGATAKPQAPLVAPRQTPQANPTPQPQAPAAQPQAPTAHPPAPVETPKTPTTQPATAQPATAPAVTTPATGGQTAAPTNLRQEPEVKPQPAPQRPPVQTPPANDAARLIPFMPPGFGGKPPNGPSPRREAEATPGRPSSGTSPSRTETGGASSAAATTAPVTTAPAPAPDAVKPAGERPVGPQPQPAPGETTRPVTVPGAGTLPPSLDLAPKPPATPAAPVSAAPANATSYSAELFQSRSKPAPAVPSVQAPVSAEMLQRVDLPSSAGMVGGPKPGTYVVHSNRPEIVTSVPAGGAVLFSSRDTANGCNHAFKPGETVNFMISNQNLTGTPLNRTIAVRNEGTEPMILKTNYYSSVGTGEARYTTVGNDGSPRQNYETVRRGGGAMDGPGMAATGNALAGKSELPREIVVPPGKTVILANDAFPVKNEVMTQGSFTVTQPPGMTGNAKASFDIVLTQGAATPAKVDSLVTSGPMVPVSEKEPVPTSRQQIENGQFGNYGRVNGITDAGVFKLNMANNSEGNLFLLPENGEASSQRFVWNTKYTARGGAPLDTPFMVAQAAGSAPMPHGNYGAEFDMTLPLHNPSSVPQKVQVFMGSGNTGDSAAFRGNMNVTITNPDGTTRKETLSIMQRPNTTGTTPLAEVTVPPGGRANITLDTIYPANTTPPHYFDVKSTPVQ
ncbi:DUF3370 family protein [Salinarimonas soli]|uniref:DUF3370 family protein n=1 Tax=Salinarimonas soli TaxID=1638099 RepID=A0A5B2VET8_9HYPH|nr:DUF3370 family protein [Salinarimonas soli]KAA2236707.1 DUF3370 family protein [Salinarimonas soli]